MSPVTEYQLHYLDSLAAVLNNSPQITPPPKPMREFDPNLVTGDSLIAWGLPLKVAHNLIRYREAGGAFSAPEQVRKIYGMTDSLWLEIEPYLKLSSPPKNASAKPPQHSLIDLNTVDTTAFIKIRGIGPVLSNRIVKYGNLLGGYYSLEQLNEVYGLSPVVLNRLKRRVVINSDFTYHKLSLNSLDVQQLARHPYISFALAKAIVAYRESHGSFVELEKLKAIHLMGDSTYIKVYPYLDF